MIPLFGINDPLLQAVVSGGSASADLKLADNTSSSGGDQPYVQVTVAPGVVELLGGSADDATLTLTAGQSQTIAEGTPAESSVSVGALTKDDDATYEDSDLTGSRATASATEVNLLTGIEGGITLTLSKSEAGVFGKMAPPAVQDETDAAPEPLPHTGGGAAALAALALGGAFVMRRRKD